ncbi:hypothetical protein ACHQM5_024709 [Ranunculus cassubicifolius]
MSATEAEKTEEKKGGELLFCGGTNWDTLGRKGVPNETNLISPTRLRPLMNIDIRFVASGCASAHCVALDVQGRCYTWGKNKNGQLGHGDFIQRDRPTLVSALSKYTIIKAGAGRSHTVVVTDEGNSFSFGWNKHGQLGSGSTKNESEKSPVPCGVPEVTTAVCGGDFTVWLSSVEGSSILTAGLPQYGQLGHGTDNEYNTRDSSVKLAYEAQPRPKAIASLAEKSIVKVACGTNHTVAVDSNGFVYTWGYGGYGRLGHREQKDEFSPRLVEVFQRNNVLPPDAIISAGSVNSACTAGGGQLYIWGKIKSTGDDWMYPKPLMDLSGWNIRCMDSGSMHHFVGADDSCISWGLSQCGELGHGPLGPKSSANPKKVEILNGVHVMSVACGFSHSLIVVDRTDFEDRLDQLDVYDGKDPGEGSTVAESECPVAKKPKQSAAKASPKSTNKRKKSKDVSESEDDDEEEDNGSEESSEDEESHRSNGHAKGRGGRGKKGAGRGRGRPPAGKKTPEPAVKTSSGKRGRPRKS